MVQNNFPLGHSLIVQYIDSYCDIWVGRVKYLTSADWRRISMTNLCFPSIFTNCIGQLLLWHARRENKQVWTDRVALVRSSYLNQHCYNNNPPLINFAPKDVASLAEVAVRIWRYKLRIQRTWHANEGGVIWLSTTDRSQLIGSPAKPTLVTLWSPWSARYTATLSITLNV